MNEAESNILSHHLSNVGFSDHDRKVVLAILEGDRTMNQEDIIDTSDYNIMLLRKLGWYKRVKKAIKDAGLQVSI